MSKDMPRLSIDFISVLNMPPVEFVHLAAELGCDIGLALQPILPENPHGYPAWSLGDAELRGATIAALKDCGVAVAIGEGFLARADTDIADAAADMDLLQELGARRVNLVSIDPDLPRAFDQAAQFAVMAATRGMRATLEYLPGLPIGNLATALDVVRHANNPSFGVLVDAMHFFRSGSTPAELASVDPASIGYVQVCDVPLTSKYADYAYEARFERLPPGEGELPLAELIASIPADVAIGLEIPRLAMAKAGVGPKERLAGAIATTRELVRQAEKCRVRA
jgi:sugar phosphate isomerase/epimerase